MGRASRPVHPPAMELPWRETLGTKRASAGSRSQHEQGRTRAASRRRRLFEGPQKVTDRDPQWYVDAVEELAALSMFPTERGARKAIMGLLWRMVDTKEKLDWLTATMIDRVGTWHGPSELRGVYCTRFKPADGIEGICAISHGFTRADCEAE